MIPQTPALLTFEEDILNSSHLHKAVAVVTKAKMSRLKLMFMTAEYKIDILQNEIRGFKGLRIFATIFIIFFFGAGLLYIIQAYHKNSSWPTYLTALTPFGMALMIYFQSKGKWIYRRFLIINSEAITWSRSTLFSPTLLYWPDIKKIQFEYTSIKFELRMEEQKALI